MSEVLSGKKREKTGKVATKEVRRSGKIPAVLYGLKDNFSFSVCPNSLSDILKAKGQNSLIDLALKGLLKFIGNFILNINAEPVAISTYPLKSK